MKPVWIVGFTGHRPGEGKGRRTEQITDCRKAIHDVFSQLQLQVDAQGGRLELMTGLAEGADLLAAEVARELKIPLHVSLPMPPERFAKDFDPEKQSWDRAKQIVEAVAHENSTGSLRVARGSHQPPECYYEAGIQMLEATDLLVALWNQQPEKGLGGTAEIVEHARKMQIPVVSIDPADRGSVNDTAASGWPMPDKVWQEVKAACGRPAGGLEEIETTTILFERLDQIATRAGKSFRGLLVWSMGLHFFAALLAATTAALWPVFHQEHLTVWVRSVPKLMVWIELLAVSVACYLMWCTGRRKIHHLWRATRFAAEVVRGLRATAGIIDPLYPVIARFSPAWRRFAISAGLQAKRETGPLQLEAFKQAYLRDRIEYQQHIYFAARHMRAARLSNVLQKISVFASWTAPLFVLAGLVVKYHFEELLAHDFIGALVASWFPIALPLAAGAATSLIVATDVARRKERYAMMRERLDQADNAFMSLRTEGTVRRAVIRTERILDDELLHWHHAANNAGH